MTGLDFVVGRLHVPAKQGYALLDPTIPVILSFFCEEFDDSIPDNTSSINFLRQVHKRNLTYKKPS
jgi:hypothetical protein